jgi:hypothetical protein
MAVDYLLQENGDYLFQENSDKIILDVSTVAALIFKNVYHWRMSVPVKGVSFIDKTVSENIDEVNVSENVTDTEVR